MVDLRVAHQEHRHDRDADRRAKIAHQAEQRGCVGAVARVERGEGNCRQRHEHHSHTQALDHTGAKDQPVIHLRREARHRVERLRGQEKTDDDENSGVDPVHEPPNDEHRNHRAETARTYDDTDGDSRIAENGRQHWRQQRHRGQDQHTHDEDERQASHEVAVEEYLGVDKGMFRRHCVNDEHPETGDGQAEVDPYLDRRNQSTSPPRSSSSCSAPTPSDIMAKPKKSKLRTRRATAGR